MRELTQVLKQFSKYQLSAVVVAVPGVVQKNCSVRLGNRDWGDFSLVETVQKLFDCSIYFENDANLAAGLCGDGTKPNRYGCCPGEVFKEVEPLVFGCCPKDGNGQCVEPIK